MKRSEVLATNIRIEDLELGVFTPRKRFYPKYIEELAEDIKARGQLKPIITRPHPEKHERYQCIDGEHRVRAVKKLGEHLIRAEVRMLNDVEAWILALKVNQMHGKRLEKMEVDLHIQRLRDEVGLTFEEIKKELGMSLGDVYEAYKRATDLSPKVRDAIFERSKIKSMSACAKLAQLDQQDQDFILNQGSDLSDRKITAVVDSFKVAETPAEKELIVKKLTDSEISSKTAMAVANVLKRTEIPEKRMEVLTSPLEALEEVFPEPEVLEEAVTVPPEEAVIEVFTCPNCGKKLLVNWYEHKAEWQ